jgi:lipopolysaccharide/colanic/teichoic acid biosynthesis glycosyltransferase
MQMKRLFDILFSLVGLSLLALPFAVIVPAVKLSSQGSVFYRQQRIGRGGKPFWLYKFRTMYAREGGALVTVEGDRRITPVGRVLRRWKLDELPQLWNVLIGDMRIVGPRPEAERLVRQYTPEQRWILEITPGLAGMSQLVYPHEAELLRGCRDPEEVYVKVLMPRKIAVDLEYERNRTFLTDLYLLGKLLLLIVLGKSRDTAHDLDAWVEIESNLQAVDKAKEPNPL